MPASSAKPSCTHCGTMDADQIERIGIIGRDKDMVCVKFWCNACAKASYVWMKEDA